jgi:cell division protein FtsI/penicillin-binding protein 2
MKKFNTHATFSSRTRLLCLGVLIAFLAACSSFRFAYNQGDTLLYWWMNAYLDLDSEQSASVKQDIDQLFAWHRKTQLPDYSQVLARAQKQLAGNPTQADLIADYRDIQRRGKDLLLKAAPELADLALTIKPDQIARMEKKFAKNNKDFRKKFLGDEDDRRKARYKKSLEQFEQWFGNFSNKQEDQIRRLSDARPNDSRAWFEERVRRQQMIGALLRKIMHPKPDKETATALIRDAINSEFARYETGEKKAFFDAFLDATTRYTLEVIRMTTPEQKAHAHKRIQGWIGDLNALAAQQK